MTRTEIRISGFGGQGVILAGHIIGKAVAVMEGRHATLNQSFGPEARGSACSAQLIVSGEPVTYPYVISTDILLAMSRDAYRRFKDEVREGGLVLIDDSLVVPDECSSLRTLGVPATEIAEELGRRIVANMAMIGLLVGATGIVSEEAARDAIRTSVPSGTEELNLAAFTRGAELGRGAVGERQGLGVSHA